MVGACLVNIRLLGHVGDSHEGVKEDKEVATDVLGHVEGSFPFKVVADVGLEVADMLWHEKALEITKDTRGRNLVNRHPFQGDLPSELRRG